MKLTHSFSLKLSLFFVCGMSLSSLALAQPRGLTTVTHEDVARLESMHQQASDFLIRNDFEGAIRIYSDILLMEPDDETAYTGLGQIYMVLGQQKKAHDAFQNALHINSQNHVAILGIQKIMDPDGAEGMVSKQELEEGETRFADAVDRQVYAERSSFDLAPLANTERRSGAVRAKRVIGPASVRPVQASAIKESRLEPRRATPRVATSSSLGRLGLLHAQRIQMALKNAGLYDGVVHGMIDGRTKNAVRQFQLKNGIQPSGRVTTETWTKLSDQLELI